MTEINIVYEDEGILILDKPAGLVVNRSETLKEGTLQDQLGDYFSLGKSLGIGDRAGIVHRLDRETSGLMVVAKTEKAFSNMQAQFKSREVQKEYIALVHGHLKEDVVINAPIGRVGSFGKFGVVYGGREAMTDLELIKRYQLKELDSIELDQWSKPRLRYIKNHGQFYSLVSAFPKTGRTHQIRVHLKHIGHPVVTDLIYGPSKLLKFDLMWCPRLFLHAKTIEFTHPVTGKRVFFDSDLPKDLKDAMLNLKEFKI